MENQRFVPGDPILIENIVSYLKAKGLFDEFRHECLADVDTKSSYQNMSQRVDGYTSKFLIGQTWNPDMNKNELRNKLRKNIDESGMLGLGSDHVVEQVINPKIGQLFLPKIIEVVHQYVKEENEKLNKRLQINDISSSSSENNDGISVKTKTPVLDPIADILSFTCSKPKSNPQSTLQKSETVHKKAAEVSQRIDKKKEDANFSAKPTEILPKPEKKEEENTQLVKNVEVSVKSEQVPEDNVLDSSEVSEKVSEDIEVKLEVVESTDSDETGLKPATDLKEIKLKKDFKPEEMDSPGDTAKKPLKDDVKVEKKKLEDTKPIEGINTCEDNKTNNVTSKSISHNKPKHEPEKSKKLKIHSSQKHPSSSSDLRKPKIKETSETKLQSDKHSKSASSKLSKPSKESSSFSKGTSSKPVKKEKSEADSNKTKSSDSQSSKSSIKKSSSKPNSLKTELSKSKSSDKPDKEKHSKVQISKPKESSSTNVDKGNKVVHQSSSSYDSSQSSDFDKSQQITNEDQKKQKHYSKHNKRDSSAENSSTKDTKKSSDLKRSFKKTDQTAVKKHKNENSSKLSFKDKLKEDMVLHNSAKTISRSNSLSGSTSSSMSKDTQSDDASESSSKQSEKKKKSEKERCSTPQNIPRPPPPPPPSSDLVVTETTSSSQDDTTQEESGTLSSEDESYSEGESSDEGSSDSDDSDSHTQASDHNSVVEPADLSEIYDSFLYSSSSSDFEGFCSSPERNKEGSSDLSVSSVHTSDLSSYEDEVSVEDLSSEDGPEPGDQKVKKKLTVREAQELLRSKEAQKSSDSIKVAPYEGTLMKEKSSEISLPASASILSSEEENSPRQEPRRELRRERKLNPKYASNEYTSIFNSKRTSFITKQMNLSPQKSPSSSSSASSNKVTEVKSKEKSVANKNYVATETNPDTATSNDIPSSAPNEMNNKTVKKVDKKRAFEAESVDDLSCNENNLESSSPNKLSPNIKNPSMKTIENKIAKDLNPNGIKRKFDGSDKTENKRLCIRNSIDKDNNSKRDVNENKTFNNQNIKKSVLSSNNLHKQKANGDVLKKVDHMRKSSQS